jgi:hypothetical protein
MKEWQRHPFPTEEEVREWYDDPKCDFNLGFLCGAPSGLVAIDIDSAGGRTLLQAISHELAHVTWQYRTGKGSRILYRCSGAIGSVVVRRGREQLEILGDGRQSVLPPSMHPTGVRYEWVHGYTPLTLGRPADAPDWLLARVGQAIEISSDSRTHEINWQEMISNRIDKGTRDNTLTQLAGHLFAPQSLPPEEVYLWLSIINKERCKPPLPERDVRRIVKSISKRVDDEIEDFTDKYNITLEAVSGEV